VPQAESFFSEANAAAAASAAYTKNEATLARRVAQLPRPVMTGRTDNSITITVDKRGPVGDDRMAVSVGRTQVAAPCRRDLMHKLDQSTPTSLGVPVRCLIGCRACLVALPAVPA
jgi:hypothetical protein